MITLCFRLLLLFIVVTIATLDNADDGLLIWEGGHGGCVKRKAFCPLLHDLTSRSGFSTAM